MSTAAVLDAPAAIPVHVPHRSGIDVGTRTVYLKLQLGCIGDKRLMQVHDLDVGEADKRMFRLAKRILASKELKKIQHHDRAIRAYITGICLPFEPGVHFLPIRAVNMVEAELRRFREKREELVAEFLAAYPLLREDARRRLKKFFNERDYPPVEDVAVKFTMAWDYLSFSTPDQIREVAPEIFEEQRQRTAKQFSEAMQEIQLALRTGLCKMVEHLRDRLAPDAEGRRKRLHETAVTNLTEFLSHFDLRNVTDDAELKQVVDQLRGMLKPISLEELKSTDTVRQRIERGLSQAAEQLGSLVHEAPIRRIRFARPQ